MRFVFAITRLTTNGPSFSRVRLAQGLRRRGHDVTILTMVRHAEIDVPTDVDVATVDRPVEKYPHGAFGRFLLARSIRRWIRQQAQIGPIDFFSSSLTGTDRLVAMAGVENARYWIHIATTQLLGDSSRPGRMRRRRKLYVDLYDRQRVIGVSQGVIDDLADLGARPAEARLLYNAYDIDTIRQRAEQTEPDVPAEPFLLFAGRFASAKRLDVLFQAVRALDRPIRLLLLTEDTPALRELIDEHGLTGQVTVLGYRQNPYPFMRAAAALVLSSDREGFPNVLVEALICGTPAISTDCRSGPAEILTGRYRRYLSPPGDAPALSRNIADILAEPYPIEAWLYERFTLDHALDELEAMASTGSGPRLGRMRLWS
ncbi:glycosyltransferase [Consotaella aegiceratis]|uniref:glycosyltransferase n=1 Tax=Consotaella aegiceratis TaxID=3097961 RepID=UPI002F4206ED